VRLRAIHRADPFASRLATGEFVLYGGAVNVGFSHRRAFALVVSVWLVLAAATVRAQCVGDCNGDGRVAVGELIVGVNIALGERALGDCVALDRNGNGRIEISELLAAVNAALTACPTPMATATPTATATATPSPTPNLPPQVESLPVYRTFPGLLIDLPLPVSDPEGGALTCEAMPLPAGADLDAETNNLRWTPAEDQLGAFRVPFSCADLGTPPLAASGELAIKVSPPDQCAILDCDPATGCATSLPDAETSCCTEVPAVRVAEPDADCPEGRVMFLGRNTDGTFGRLQNCDYMRMFVSGQTGASLRFNAEIRCLRTTAPLKMRARLETPSRGVAFDVTTPQNLFFRRRDDGFHERFALQVAIPNGPYFDLEDSEANLHVTLIDADEVSVTESLRVILTSTPQPNLPGPEPTPTVVPQ
jgi:hypothetical protein